jgi:hypothetical protein
MNSVAWVSDQHLHSQIVQARSGNTLFKGKLMFKKGKVLFERIQGRGHTGVGRQKFRAHLLESRAGTTKTDVERVIPDRLGVGPHAAIRSARCEHTSHGTRHRTTLAVSCSATHSRMIGRVPDGSIPPPAT